MSDPLAVRFSNSFQDWLGRAATGLPAYDAAKAVMAGQDATALTFRRHDEDTGMHPESTAAKRPLLILKVVDAGRVKPYTPIRILRAELTIRALCVTPGSTKPATGALTTAQFNAICGALEYVLGQINLNATFTSVYRGIVIMLCTRQPGTVPTRIADGIRSDSYALDIRAVALENTRPINSFDNTLGTFDSALLTFDAA